MALDRSDVLYVSKLARIELRPEQVEPLVKDMKSIVSFVEKISEVDTTGVEPLANVMDRKNVFREDQAGESLPREKVEQNAPRFKNGHIVVPAVIE